MKVRFTSLFSRSRVLAVACWLQGALLFSQTNTCFWQDIPVVAADPGDTVCLPVRVHGFTDMVSMQYLASWNPTDMDFVRIDLVGSQLGLKTSDFGIFPGQGEIRVSWWSVGGVGISVPDSGLLFSVCLRVKPGAAGYLPLTIGSGLGFIFETVNAVGQKQARLYTEGGVQVGTLPPAGVPRLTQMCATSDDCGKFSGAITTQVAGGTPPYSYLWTGPGGVAGTTQNLAPVSGGQYTLVVTDAAAATRIAYVEVFSTPSPVKATTTIQPAFCGQPTGCIQVSASGGQPPYTYTWSSGAGASNCDLVPGNYALTVADANGCQRILPQLTVPNDTILQIEVAETPIYTCNGTGSAAVVPKNGMAPYQYAWSTGATTPYATDLAEGAYGVTVTAPGGCSASGSAWIVDKTVQYWNLSLQKSCPSPDSSSGALTLKFNKNGGIDFPVVVSWSDGTTRLIPEKPANGILDSLVGVPSGAYWAMVTDTGGCHQAAWEVLNCLPWAPVADSFPGFYIKDEYLTPQYDVDSCVGVYARHFNNLQEVDFSVYWSTNNMRLRNLGNFGLPGLKSDDFSFSADSSRLGMRWTAPGGMPLTLPGPVQLFEVCFTPQKNDTYETLSFDTGPVFPRVVDGTGAERGFIGMEGDVLFGLWFPAGPSVCDFGIQAPSCASDGFGRILLERCNAAKAIDGGYTFNGEYVSSLEGLLFADSGLYRIYASQPGKWSGRLLAHIPWKAGNASACVWPGDADDNNAVNHYDLLYLGLGYDAAGPVRPGAALDWYGQDAPDWHLKTTGRAVNFKNIDTNGDGSINAADTLAIVQNWGRVVNLGRDNPFDTPLNDSLLHPTPSMTLQTDTLPTGMPVPLPLLLGSQAMPMDSVLGLAFSISYDPKVVQPNLTFKPAVSWLGDPAQDLLWIQRNFPGQGRIDVAITRTDGQPVSGYGLIGDMIIVIEDNIFFQAPPEAEGILNNDSVRHTLLFFSGLRTVGVQEDPGRLSGKPVELVVRRTSTGAQEKLAWSRRISLYPNPATDNVRVVSPDAGLLRAEVWNASGQLQTTVRGAGTGTLDLRCAALPPGVYMARLFTERGVSAHRFVVER